MTATPIPSLFWENGVYIRVLCLCRAPGMYLKNPYFDCQADRQARNALLKIKNYGILKRESTTKVYSTDKTVLHYCVMACGGVLELTVASDDLHRYVCSCLAALECISGSRRICLALGNMIGSRCIVPDIALGKRGFNCFPLRRAFPHTLCRTPLECGKLKPLRSFTTTY